MLKLQVQVEKLGQRLIIAIPDLFAAELHITEETPVEIRLEGNAMVLRLPEQEPSLDELLARITDENMHGLIDFGLRQGNEVW